MAELMEAGMFYMHGRDRGLRTILVFRPVEVNNHPDVPLEEAMMVTHFLGQLIIDFYFHKEKTENWLTIFDLDGLGLFNMPTKHAISFINVFKHNYYQRNVGMFVLNAPMSLSLPWKIVSVFIPESTKQKIKIDRNNTSI
jgi:hypothetical protein